MILQVLWEITQGTLGKAPAAVTETPGASAVVAEPTVEEDPEELMEMQSRLEALRS